jgi:hypothetical protein
VTRRRDDELDELMADWPEAERKLVVQLRALREEPGTRVEPDWAALERDIGKAVDAEAARPRAWAWLTRWWRPALGIGLVAAAAAIVIVARREPASEAPRAERAIDAGAPVPIVVPDEPRPVVEPVDTIGLGAEGEIEPDELDEDVLDDVLAELDTEAWTDDTPQPEVGLVPDLGLEWVDDLDDDELEAVDQWLAVLDEGT